jgi:peptidyl-tRNA hydrolase, PTH1 family
MLLLVGLGNPGPRYAGNRHNIGYMAVDEIVRRHSFGPWRARFQGLATEGRIGARKVLALKPETYMNESGLAVGAALRFYKLAPGAVTVLYDEIDLRAGKIKVKLDGGHAGHNGLRSIDAHIGKDYWRVRLGIGHPGDKDLVHLHVLSNFAKSEAAWVEPLLTAVAEEIPRLLEGDEAGFMSRVAHRTAPPKPKKEPGADPESAPNADPSAGADKPESGGNGL